MSYRVVFTDHTFDDLSIEADILAEADAEVVDGEASDEPLESLVDGADGLIVMYEAVDGDVMDAMPDCKVVSRTGIGFDNVDVDAATERGIRVTNVPDYCIEEVADHTLALVLSLQRKLRLYDEQVRGGDWDVTAGRTMHRLSERNYGLVGFGNTARAVGERAAAFGMDVHAYDAFIDDEAIREGGATPVDELEALLETADVVSVHVPLNDATRGLIDAAELETMKETAFVVNTARGGIVDEAALAEAIEAGEVAGAGFDVLTEEPPGEDHPLVGLDDVIVTPHAAWNSAESLVELREKAARNVLAVLQGEEPPYLVNEDVRGAD
jgi:D-3-phosphoglycerate dehydrogenase